MTDREQVIKALEYCDNSEDCRGCVYWEETLHINDCPVNRYALELLKEQDDEVEWCERCGRIRLKSYRQK